MGNKHPPLATPMAGNAEFRSACKLSEVEELAASYLKART